MLNDLYDRIRSIPSVDALALAGSRASGNTDEKSDYDLYVYGEEIVPAEIRREYLSSLCSQAEIGNAFFESEDNLVLKDGTFVDVIYRCTGYFEDMINMMFEYNIAKNGYSTCFWHNIKTSEIIFDKSGRFTRLYESAQREYPEELAQAIIKRNMALLNGYLPSYDKQVGKAFYRHDYVSVNHRVAAFLESYFDVIFAVNRLTHPGEKKLVQICLRDCKILPENFNENLMKLFENMFLYDVSDILDNINKELKKIV